VFPDFEVVFEHQNLSFKIQLSLFRVDFSIESLSFPVPHQPFLQKILEMLKVLDS
jgi:hypothetical protein